MAAMTFQQWLRRQCHREDPVGDLARDAAHDRDKPYGRTTRAQWRAHLMTHIDACEGAFQALERAWDEYEAE